MASNPLITAWLRTTEYRGDHSAEIVRVHEIIPGETVQELVDRLLPPKAGEPQHDWIELRVVHGHGLAAARARKG